MSNIQRESRVGSVIDPYVPIIQLWRQCFANIVPTIYHSFFFSWKILEKILDIVYILCRQILLLLHHPREPTYILCCISYVILYSLGQIFIMLSNLWRHFYPPCYDDISHNYQDSTKTQINRTFWKNKALKGKSA